MRQNVNVDNCIAKKMDYVKLQQKKKKNYRVLHHFQSKA